MKILFLNAYFEPESIPFTHLEKDLLEGLTKDGHEIYIVCPTPTCGISKDVAKQYKKIKTEDLYDGKVHVRRFWAPQETRNPITRAFRYFWCNFREIAIGKKYKDVDVIFSNSTPPTQGLVCSSVKKKLKVPFIYNLQDIFPDSLVTTKLGKKDSLLWKIGRKIEDSTYQNADKVIVISESFKRNIMDKGVPENKIEVVSNWIDIESVKPVPREKNKLIDEFCLDAKKFIVVYAGNFGAAQGADVILKAADILKEEKDISFVIFGGGAEFEKAKTEVKELALENVELNPLLPADRVPEVYSLGNVALITCKPGVGNSGMPSKTWSIMACNTPVIASFDTDSELAKIIQMAKSGVCVEPANPTALADAIKNAYLLYKQKGAEDCNSREFVEQYAEKKICVQKYINVITNVVE